MYVKIPTKNERANLNYILPIRREIVKEIMDLLDDRRKEIYLLYHFAIVGTDRLTDYGLREVEFISLCKDLMMRVWNKEGYQSIDEYETNIVELTQKLRGLHDEGFSFAKHVYESLLDNFDGNYKDVARRWMILSEKNLKELRVAVTQPYLLGLLHLLIPEITRNQAVKLSLGYSLPGKVADDLADFQEDVPLGFINVPKEEIENLSGILLEGDKVTVVYKNELKLKDNYISEKIKEVEKMYKDADKKLEEILSEYPNHEMALKLFKKHCYSWLKEAKEKYS